MVQRLRIPACHAADAGSTPAARSIFGRQHWRACAPYKRARSGGLPGTGGIVTLGGYHFRCGWTKGSTQVHTLGGGGAVPPSATNILPSWCSRPARLPEEQEVLVRCEGSARGYRPKVGHQPSKLRMTGSSPATRSSFSGVAQRQSERLLTVRQRFESSHRSHLRASSGFCIPVSKTGDRGFDTFRPCHLPPKPARLQRRCSFNGRTALCGSANLGSIPRHRPKPVSFSGRTAGLYPANGASIPSYRHHLSGLVQRQDTTL
jgi:hypothetical protein